jgi:hypothetical protein
MHSDLLDDLTELDVLRTAVLEGGGSLDRLADLVHTVGPIRISIRQQEGIESV